LVALGSDGDPLLGVERSGTLGVPEDRVQLNGRGKDRGDEESPVQHGHSGKGQRDGQ
jgi:hypothetical protein